MKKAINLKKRLDDLRDEPEMAVEVMLNLDAELCRMLKKLADGERLSLEAYIEQVVKRNAETIGAGERE